MKRRYHDHHSREIIGFIETDEHPHIHELAESIRRIDAETTRSIIALSREVKELRALLGCKELGELR